MTSWKTLLVATTLAAMLPLLIQAQQAADPELGTWKLNLAKSKYDPGPGPKSVERTYSLTPQGTKISIHGVSATGAAIVEESTFTYDGKQHPITGVADYDRIAIKRVTPFEATTDLIRAGKVIGKIKRVVSQDGKTLTVSVHLTNAKGELVHDLSVYDRQ
jgi:hypothetical protein